jgi:hypothetical protein
MSSRASRLATAPYSALAATVLAGLVVLTSSMGVLASEVATGPMRQVPSPATPAAQPDASQSRAKPESVRVHTQPLSLAALAPEAFADWDHPASR